MRLTTMWIACGAVVIGFLAGCLVSNRAASTPAPPFVTADVSTYKGTLTIATYNVKNLFDKYDNPYTNDGAAKPDKERQALAEAIRAVDADVLILQEVEAGGVLREFAQTDLAGMKYDYIVDATTEDARGITVAALSRYPVIRITSHRLVPLDEAAGAGPANRFARDLLRVDVRVRPHYGIAVYGVHLKSKRTDDEKDKNSNKRRLTEAVRIREMLREEMGAQGRYVFLGDCNDAIDTPVVGAIRAATTPPLTDALAGIPGDVRITFENPTYREAIDQVLLSPVLAQTYVDGSARIFAGDPFPKASDHRPVRITLKVP